MRKRCRSARIPAAVILLSIGWMPSVEADRLRASGELSSASPILLMLLGLGVALLPKFSRWVRNSRRLRWPLRRRHERKLLRS